MTKEPSQFGVINPTQNLRDQLDKIGVEGDLNNPELFPLSGFKPICEIGESYNMSHYFNCES